MAFAKHILGKHYKILDNKHKKGFNEWLIRGNYFSEIDC